MVQLAHYKAVNLARRLSKDYENDLLQENYFENVVTKFPEEDEDDKIVYNRDTCTQLAQHLLHVKNLPVECMKYTDIVQNLKSHEKDMSHPTSWMV